MTQWHKFNTCYFIYFMGDVMWSMFLSCDSTLTPIFYVLTKVLSMHVLWKFFVLLYIDCVDNYEGVFLLLFWYKIWLRTNVSSKHSTLILNINVIITQKNWLIIDKLTFRPAVKYYLCDITSRVRGTK